MAKRYREISYLSQDAKKKQKLTQSPEIYEIRKMLGYLIQKTASDDQMLQTCVKKINQLEKTIYGLQIENQKYNMQISTIYEFANIPIPSYLNSHSSYIS
jgi:hypothetical protein